MKSAIYPIILMLLASFLLGCKSSTEHSSQAQNYSDNSSNTSIASQSPIIDSPSPVKSLTSRKTPDPTESLTNAKVETAVNSLLGDFRLSGSVRVKGIQELPQQNSAVADLEFQQFEYGITTEGRILKAKDFKPKSLPKDGSRLPTMEEMFPPKKVVYSKDGKATLSHYTDGRWVLKEIRWGFDTGVKGNVEIR